METSLVPQNYYKPSELLNIFRNRLSRQEINMSVIGLQGIYWKAVKTYGNKAYDTLKDENSSEEIKILTPLSLRDELKNGNLVTVYGTIDGKLQQNGSIQILLNVSRVDKLKEIAISEDEVIRAEFRRIKGERGYKNVDSLLESKLFAGVRPKVSLIYAGTSITNADFEKGLAEAKFNIDFVEYRVSFANADTMCTLLAQLDSDDSDIIAIMRGGGSGIEKLDDVRIVGALTNLSKAWIYGVGHEKENLFIRNIADKVIPIPFALGTYFRDTVEAVAEKRNSSRAVLVQEVRRQYEKQIEESNKKNLELTRQLEALQKSHAKQSEEASRQIENLTKAHKESQEQMKAQTIALKNANEEAQKKSDAQLEATRRANKELGEQMTKQAKIMEEMQTQQKKQQEDFDKNLTAMQKTNNSLRESLDNLTAQNSQTTKELQDARDRAKELELQLRDAKRGCAMPGCAGVVFLIVVIIASCCFL